MQIVAQEIPHWPVAAWFAEWQPGGDVLHVFHGEDVVVQRDRLFEGVWDGSFEEAEFQASSAFCGTGLVVTGDDVHLIPPFHPQERIYYSGTLYRNRRCASNSLLSWLTQTGETLDLAWPDYYADLLQILRQGQTPALPSIRLTGGRAVQLVELSGWATQAGRRLPPRKGPAFEADFAGYRSFLAGQIRALSNNATQRPRPKRLATALSKGFDSVAISVLAAEAGVNQALTFTMKEDARDIGAKLGLSVVAKGQPEVAAVGSQREFFLLCFGKNRALSAFEAEHRDAMLFSGHGGDDVWGMQMAFHGGQNLARPRDRVVVGNSYAEYRLRLGLVIVPTCLLGQWHWPSIATISHLPAMHSFRDGHYSRPIARRIGMEAGLRRSEFAESKAKGEITEPEQMCPQDDTAYQSFLAQYVKGDLTRTSLPYEVKHHRSIYRWMSHWVATDLADRYKR